MDMPTPNVTATDARDHATLTRIAGLLGCSTDRFFEVAPTSRPKDTSQLIQTWLAIKSSEGRDAVFAFATEILRSENR